MDSSAINHISDTGIWVAHYRAVESQRRDALFRDGIAHKLIGDHGHNIATQLKSLSKYVEFQVVIRTIIIDRFIQQLVSQGIDTVVNLGAGLDARPYRLKLPSHLRWIEVDYPHIVALKNEKLRNEIPVFSLERIGLDLENRQERQKLFSRIGTSSKNILILMEGVIGYLNLQQAGELADDLHAEKNFHYWITECHSSFAYRFMKDSSHRKGMNKAPFQLMPKDWHRFFLQHHWEKQEVAYLMDEAQRVNRPMPQPLWAKILLPLTPPLRRIVRQMTGYVIYRRK